MATKTQTEQHHRDQLAKAKHDAWLAKREGQIERYDHRINILAHRSDALTDAEVTSLRGKWDTLKHEVSLVKRYTGTTEKKHRDAASAAFKDLRDSFRSTQEKHGLVGAKK